MNQNEAEFPDIHPANAAPNLEGEPPELPDRGPAPRRRRPDLFPWLPKFPPMTQQCVCEADAVHRPGWSENANLPGAIVPPNGWPAMASLELPSGNYVVTAKAQVTNLSTNGVALSATPFGPFFDSAWLRLAPRWQPGEMGIVLMHGVVTIRATDRGVLMYIGHTSASGDLVAQDVWLSAIEVAAANVQTV
jgi:hypothetical protein